MTLNGPQYWGDLPREDETHGHNLGDSARQGTEQPYNVHKSSGVPSGVNTEVGTAGSSGLTSKDNYKSHSGVPQTELPDRTRTTNYPPTSATNTAQNQHDSSHKGEIAAATGAGALGAGYLASRHEHGNQNKEHHHQHKEPELAQHKPTPGSTVQPNQAGSDSLGYRNTDPSRQTGQTTSGSSYLSNDATTPGYTSGATTAGSSAAPQHHNHHTRDQAYAGAGAAGLGAAGYTALKKHDDKQFLDEDRPTAAYGSTGTGFNSTAGHTSALPGTSREGVAGHTHGGIHNTVIGAGSSEHPETHSSLSSSGPIDSSSAPLVAPHRTSDIYGQQQHTTAGNAGGLQSHEYRDRDGLAGAAGLGAGAGALAAEERYRHHKHDDKPGHQHQHNQTDAAGAGVLPAEERHHHHKHDDKPSHHHHQAEAAGVGAGVGALAAEEKHRHHKHDDKPEHRHHHNDTLQAGQASSQPAHAAATQAWNKHDNHPTSTTRAVDSSDHSRYAAPAPAGAGVAGAGAVAAYYGQGKEHEQNPRSEQSERIAERALGNDGAAHGISGSQRYENVPGMGGYESSSTGLGSQGVQNSSLGAGSIPHSSAMGSSGSGLTQRAPNSKVMHKCHQCGADNDISNYFKKDAMFKVES